VSIPEAVFDFCILLLHFRPSLLFYKQWKASQIQFMRLIVVFLFLVLLRIPRIPFLFHCSTQDSEDPEEVPFLLSLPRMPRKFLFYCHPYPCQRTDDVTPLVQLLMYRVMHLIATKILSLSILVLVLPTR
jgi:hypothetical protein